MNIKAEALGLYQSDSSSAVTSLACAVVKSCVELLRYLCGINILVVVSDIPVF